MQITMKKQLMIATVTAALLSAPVAFAGKQCKGHGHGDWSEKKIEKMQENLQLTDQQVTDIKAINKKYKDSDGKALRQAKKQSHKSFKMLNPSDANYQQQVNKLADEQANSARARVLLQGKIKADIYKVLTAEQQRLMREKMAERQQKHAHKHKDK